MLRCGPILGKPEAAEAARGRPAAELAAGAPPWLLRRRSLLFRADSIGGPPPPPTPPPPRAEEGLKGDRECSWGWAWAWACWTRASGSMVRVTGFGLKVTFRCVLDGLGDSEDGGGGDEIRGVLSEVVSGMVTSDCEWRRIAEVGL